MNKKKNDYILNIKNLKVSFQTDEGTVKAVNGVNLAIKKGQSVGIVGESGCGKSVTSYSILRLLAKNAQLDSGEILFSRKNGDVLDLSKIDCNSKVIRKIRGAEISMIFQEPMTAFSPVHTIGNQIGEVIKLHQDLKNNAARDRAVELLKHVGISNPDKCVDDYPFQLSGGMRQRAMIAMALACNPRLLVADEPTTALDVTIQAQVLKLIKKMENELDLSLMLITHDLGVIANMVDYVYVMYLGRVVEEGTVEEIFFNPLHPYTKDLLKSIPKVTGNTGKLSTIEGFVPDTYNLPSGCPFHTRCQQVIGRKCSNELPASEKITEQHKVCCFKYLSNEVKKDEIS